jgi:hypothetical protein
MFVIIEGQGTYRSHGWLFKTGATEVPDDHPVIAAIQERAPGWVILSETRDLEQPAPPPVVEPDREPYETFAGRDEKWYFVGAKGQSEPYDSEDEAAAAAQTAKEELNKVPLASEYNQVGPEAGPMTTEDFAVLGGQPVACRQPGCDHAPFRNTGARANHERVKHPELWQRIKGGTQD